MKATVLVLALLALVACDGTGRKRVEQLSLQAPEQGLTCRTWCSGGMCWTNCW